MEFIRCAACNTKVASDEAIRLYLDGPYEVCSEECKKDLPALVAKGLQQDEDNFVLEKRSRNYNFEDTFYESIRKK